MDITYWIQLVLSPVILFLLQQVFNNPESVIHYKKISRWVVKSYPKIKKLPARYLDLLQEWGNLHKKQIFSFAKMAGTLLKAAGIFSAALFFAAALYKGFPLWVCSFIFALSCCLASIAKKRMLQALNFSLYQ